MDKKQLAEAILNLAGVREILRREVPQIDKLESLDQLENLRLIRMNTDDACHEIVLDYEAVASSGFYPNIREGLISCGMEDDFLSVVKGNEGQDDEYKSLSFRFAKDITGRLIVYNPNYSK